MVLFLLFFSFFFAFFHLLLLLLRFTLHLCWKSCWESLVRVVTASACCLEALLKRYSKGMVLVLGFGPKFPCLLSVRCFTSFSKRSSFGRFALGICHNEAHSDCAPKTQIREEKSHGFKGNILQAWQTTLFET